MMYGEAGSLLKYFHLQIVENPSFQYSIELDCEEQITNIFWADAKMLIDYALFGDVVAFDTTFGTNKEHRPLGIFNLLVLTISGRQQFLVQLFYTMKQLNLLNGCPKHF